MVEGEELLSDLMSWCQVWASWPQLQKEKSDKNATLSKITAEFTNNLIEFVRAGDKDKSLQN